MEIRELTSETARHEAVPILRQLWIDTDPTDVLEWTGDEAYHLFGRFDEQTLVGVAGVRLEGVLHHARHAWLSDLVVDDARRGEGHGTALLEFVEEWARDHDCTSIALASPLEKHDVHEYYEHLEYERWGYVLERAL